MARRRPSAFEVSFPDEAVAFAAAQTESSSSRPASSRHGMGSMTPPLKRTSEGPTNARPTKRQQLLPVAYYRERVAEIRETGDLVIAGEDPDDANGEEKPIRVLSDFTFFDPRHRNEMISLATLESEDGADRECEGAGYVKAYFEDGDDEDEGQEDDLDGGGLEYVRLGAILRVTINYSEEEDPMYIETQFAWYILDMPSDQYRLYFQQFFIPRKVAQTVVSSAVHQPQQDSRTFVQRFTSTVDPFGRTFVKQDLCDAASEIKEAIEEIPNADVRRLRSVPIVKHILGEYSTQTPKRRNEPRQAPGPRNRHIPSNKLVGNPDLAVLKTENQNQTHVTPRIAALAQGLVQEVLQVVGPPSPAEDKALLARQKKRRYARVCMLIDQVKKSRRNIDWRKEDRVTPGSKYVKCFEIDGETFQVGDVVVVANKENDPEALREPSDVPLDAAVHDFFWFAKIHSICHDTRMVHIQWFEHGSGIMLEELAHPQELFLVDLCGSIPFKEIFGKVTVHWKTNPDFQVDQDDFFCKFMFDKETSAFTSISSEYTMSSLDLPPPDNCPACVREAHHRMESQCQQTRDSAGHKNGVAYGGKKFHLEDFVLYYSDGRGPANIGYIVDFKYPARETSDEAGFVVCRRVGRISDLGRILPEKMIRDERHLYMTQERVTIRIEDLLRTIYVPCRGSLTGRVDPETWLPQSPDHFFVRYEFPTLQPTSWAARKRIECIDHLVCTPCWKDKKRDQMLIDKYSSYAKKKPLATLDLFAGVGAFSTGLAQGSGSLKVTHAIEISPSAAKTFKRNSPDTVIYNQCANIMLRHTIKTWEGHKTEPLVQLYDGDVHVPPVPKKGEIKVIVAGFPCQPHSALNMYKKASDAKNNLMLNALSWIDLIRPTLAYMENVPGFLSYRLNATQATVHRVEGGIEMGGLKFLVRALIDMGYQVRFALLQAGHYGTPQGRIRFFLVAALDGTPLPELPQPSHAFPATALEIKLPYGLGTHAIRPIRTMDGTALHRPVTVNDAIGDLPRFDWKPSRARPQSASQQRERRERERTIPSLECNSSEPHCGFKGRPNYHHPVKTNYQREARAIPTQNIQHFTKCLLPQKVNRVIAIPLKANADYRSLSAVDQEWQMVNPSSYVAKKKYKPGLYGRLDKDGFFPTTVTNMDPTAKQSKVLNPYCKRMVTVRELARSQGFPDYFVFESVGNSVVTMHRQIGNAVPLPIARALGRQLKDALAQKWQIDHENAMELDDDSDQDDNMIRRQGHQNRVAAPYDSDDDESSEMDQSE